MEFVAEAGPGDFIYVPPFVPHQEINASPDEPLECVLVRSDNEAVVVNITDVDPVERPVLPLPNLVKDRVVGVVDRLFAIARLILFENAAAIYGFDPAAPGCEIDVLRSQV